MAFLPAFGLFSSLLVVRMGFHIVISALHSPFQLLLHCATFAGVGCVLFLPQASVYFRNRTA